MEMVLTPDDAKLITETMAGRGRGREYVSSSPDLCFDVSKGIMKYNCNPTPTISMQALLTGFSTTDDYESFIFTGRGVELEGTAHSGNANSAISCDSNAPLFISNHALRSISKIIGKPGEDYCYIFHPDRLLFGRVNNVCFFTIPYFFKMVVDRMRVSKSDVLFENSDCDSNQILISRSKKRLF